MKTMNKKDALTAGVVDLIVRDLEQGNCPWEQPFGGPSLPRNAVTGKPYRGINVLILWGEDMRRGFGGGRWLTYHQAMQAGAWVKRGEVGTPIVFYSPMQVTEKGKDGFPVLTADGKGVLTKTIRIVKFYTAFNIAQCGGTEKLAPVVTPTFEPLAEAERVMTATGAKIQYADVGRAFYEHTEDRIVLPPRSKFRSLEAFYEVAFHELAHWTGAPSRLDRHQKEHIKGSQGYAFEELVAELGAAFVCAHLGLPYRSQHSTYIRAWLEVIKDDPKAIFRAATKAQAACDFILGVTYSESDKEKGGG